MVEDLIMEFEESPGEVGDRLERLRAVQRSIEDALVPIMTGLVRSCSAGWIDLAAPVFASDAAIFISVQLIH